MHNDVAGGGTLLYELTASVSSSMRCPGRNATSPCGGRGACDAATGLCLCDAGFAGLACELPVETLTPNAGPGARVGPLTAGASPAYFRFDVDCEGQDAIVTLTKRGGGDLVGIVGGSDRREGPTGIDPSTDSSGMDSSDASAFRRSGVGSQVTLAARRGAPPSLDDGGYLVATAADFEDGSATLRVSAARPGTHWVAARVDAGDATAFDVRVDAVGSTSPNPWNRCERPDGQLVVEFSFPPGGPPGFALEGPVPFASDALFGLESPAPSFAAFLGGPARTTSLLDPATSYFPAASAVRADAYELDYGACGANGTVSCYVGDRHSSGKVPGLADAKKRGLGPATGRVALARSTPESNDVAYHYVRGDVRKRPGRFEDAAENAESTLWFEGAASEPGNWDLEACGALVEPEKMRGATCLVARGSCPFSRKTLACQAAGAVAVIIANTDFDEGAADNWVGSHDPELISIPTVSVGGKTANALLEAMAEVEDARVGGPSATPGDGDAETATATATATIRAYACDAPSACPACGPGVAAPENNCTSARCPGMNDARTRNCTGRGLGPNGGCALVPGGGGFACACAPGFEGDACDAAVAVAGRATTAAGAASPRGKPRWPPGGSKRREAEAERRRAGEGGGDDDAGGAVEGEGEIAPAASRRFTRAEAYGVAAACVLAGVAAVAVAAWAIGRGRARRKEVARRIDATEL